MAIVEQGYELLCTNRSCKGSSISFYRFPADKEERCSVGSCFKEKVLAVNRVQLALLQPF